VNEDGTILPHVADCIFTKISPIPRAYYYQANGTYLNSVDARLVSSPSALAGKTSMPTTGVLFRDGSYTVYTRWVRTYKLAVFLPQTDSEWGESYSNDLKSAVTTALTDVSKTFYGGSTDLVVDFVDLPKYKQIGPPGNPDYGKFWLTSYFRKLLSGSDRMNLLTGMIGAGWTPYTHAALPLAEAVGMAIVMPAAEGTATSRDSSDNRLAMKVATDQMQLAMALLHTMDFYHWPNLYLVAYQTAESQEDAQQLTSGLSLAAQNIFKMYKPSFHIIQADCAKETLTEEQCLALRTKLTDSAVDNGADTGITIWSLAGPVLDTAMSKDNSDAYLFMKSAATKGIVKRGMVFITMMPLFLTNDYRDDLLNGEPWIAQTLNGMLQLSQMTSKESYRALAVRLQGEFGYTPSWAVASRSIPVQYMKSSDVWVQNAYDSVKLYAEAMEAVRNASANMDGLHGEYLACPLNCDSQLYAAMYSTQTPGLAGEMSYFQDITKERQKLAGIRNVTIVLSNIIVDYLTPSYTNSHGRLVQRRIGTIRPIRWCFTALDCLNVADEYSQGNPKDFSVSILSGSFQL